MSGVTVELPRHPDHKLPVVQVLDAKRGSWGMLLFIATEATLFVLLFFAYYYIGHGHPTRWFHEEPPKLHYSLPMLGVLIVSSLVMHWGEKSVKQERYAAGRIAILVTLGLGIIFLVLTYLEYAEHLQHLTPRSDAYGSIFYTITSLHGLHLVLGMLMLTWVLLLPKWEPRLRTPHRPYHNAAMYWHFVDTVWLFVVLILYVSPNIFVAGM